MGHNTKDTAVNKQFLVQLLTPSQTFINDLPVELAYEAFHAIAFKTINYTKTRRPLLNPLFWVRPSI